MTVKMQKSQDCLFQSNSISNAIINTVENWNQVRAFSRSKFGHIDIILEPRMQTIGVKKITPADESIAEIFISAKDYSSLHKILNLIKQSSNNIKVNIANMKQAQIILDNEKLKKQVEELVNCVIEKNKIEKN